MNKTILEAKVEAQNKANAFANHLADVGRAAFLSHLGKKILKQDGELLEKFRLCNPAAVSPHPKDGCYHVYKLPSKHSLAWVVKVNVPYGDPTRGCTVYAGAVAYVGHVDGIDTLERLSEPCEYRTDWSVLGVMAARTRVEDAQRMARDAEIALGPFGIYDR